jgi:hypothetical protein
VLDSVGSELLSRIRATSRSREQKILRGALEVMKQERIKSSSAAGNFHLPMARGMIWKQLTYKPVEAASK